MRCLLDRPNAWRINWDEQFLYLQVAFKRHGSYGAGVTLTYYEWKRLALLMEKAVQDRPSIANQALHSIGSRSINYFPIGVAVMREESPGIKKWVDTAFHTLTAADRRTKTRAFVQIAFGSCEITLARRAYVIFEADVLVADRRLDLLLRRIRRSKK